MILPLSGFADGYYRFVAVDPTIVQVRELKSDEDIYGSNGVYHASKRAPLSPGLSPLVLEAEGFTSSKTFFPDLDEKDVKDIPISTKNECRVSGIGSPNEYEFYLYQHNSILFARTEDRESNSESRRWIPLGGILENGHVAAYDGISFEMRLMFPVDNLTFWEKFIATLDLTKGLRKIDEKWFGDEHMSLRIMLRDQHGAIIDRAVAFN